MELTFFHIFILGIIEGLTEFIPVSSTAHLVLTSNILGLSDGAFLDTVIISIQSGAMIALCIYFFKKIIVSRTLWWKIGLGTLPVVVIGILVYPFVSDLFSSLSTIAYALIIGGTGLVVVKETNHREDRDPSLKEFILLGAIQVVSLIPGVSRSGSTLLGGSLIKIPKNIIVDTSFLLALPTIIGATLYDLLRQPIPTPDQSILLIFGIIISCITSLFAIRFFLNFLKEKPLAWFGWYRIFIGLLILFSI